jgi:intergrase/recombinase
LRAHIKNGKMVRGVGFEPTNPYGTAASGVYLGNGAKIDWENYKTWLFREYMPVTAKGRLRYARKYADCLRNRDFSSLKLLTNSQRIHAMKALAVLSKFLGIYEEFRSLVKNYGLKWSGKKSSDLIIERLTKTVNADEIYDWIKKVKTVYPEIRNFMDLMVTTGLRYNEAIESYNLIIKLARNGKLHNYYNIKSKTLEHFRFKEIFIRRSKKVYISFVPKELVERIISQNELVEWNATKKKVARNVEHLRFADLREFHGTFLTKYLRQPEIDFLHGRSSASVFMKHYFNVALITGLKTRTFKAIREIEKKINDV